MRILVIQTAFIGDAILGTPVLEKLHNYYPEAEIDYLVRKESASVFEEHPFLKNLLVLDKKSKKNKQVFQLIKFIRARRYDYVVNLQRFFTSGFITALSGARHTIGYKKNPLSMFFSSGEDHQIGDRKEVPHEIERNQQLIRHLTDANSKRPAIYPTKAMRDKVRREQSYICIAPASIWFTKQLPPHKWVEMLNQLPAHIEVIMIGAPADHDLCETIRKETSHPAVYNMAGQYSLLESAALMEAAIMNYVNDSAPAHLASAVNAPVTMVYCSTVPAFGFGPVSTRSFIIETDEELDCRPCGLHGYKKCPQGHFKCADIPVNKLLDTLPSEIADPK